MQRCDLVEEQQAAQGRQLAVDLPAQSRRQCRFNGAGEAGAIQDGGKLGIDVLSKTLHGREQQG